MPPTPLTNILLLLAAVTLAVPVAWQQPRSAAPAFDGQEAIRGLVYAGAVYCPVLNGFNVSQWKLTDRCNLATPDVQVLDSWYVSEQDAFALLLLSPAHKQIVLTFKGTNPNNLTDWIVDIKSYYWYTHNCTLSNVSAHAHEGFCDYWLSIKKAGAFAATLAAAARHPDYQVLATGHSLGGSVATLAALDLMSYANIPVVAYTYGEPRTGTAVFADLYFSELARLPTAALYRVTHYDDVVPHLPPCKLKSWSPESECLKDDEHAYHTGWQFRYPENMTEAPTRCSTVDGDMDCSPEAWEMSVNDHLFYFGERVSEFCCPGWSDTSEPAPTLDLRPLPSTARARTRRTPAKAGQAATRAAELRRSAGASP